MKPPTKEEFLPGKAINFGIRNSTGEYIVILSGHCIPVDEHWLEKLVEGLKEHKVAGVYGRQEPLPFTPDRDKRDLAMIFGFDRKVQKKDPFFHNANSAIKRQVWEEIPFDEDVMNIEDRVWGKAVISRGYELVYEPEASVYHYHGIHQNGNEDCCKNVVRILESLDSERDKRTEAVRLEDRRVA